MRLLFQHLCSRKGNQSTHIELQPIPSWFSYVGHFGQTTNDVTMMSQQLYSLFGLSIEKVLNVFLSHCWHGYDCKGLFCVEPHFWPFRKRPHRVRFIEPMLLEAQRLYIHNPTVNQYDAKTVERKYECANCHRTGKAKDWPWRFMAGVENSDYISECPSCGQRNGDILERIVEGRPLRIISSWDHGAPFVFPSSGDYKEVQPLFRGQVRQIIEPTEFYVKKQLELEGRG